MLKEKEKKEVVSSSDIQYEVNFGVYIAEMNKSYSKQELENDAEACAYLVEIGSQAVSELKKQLN